MKSPTTNRIKLRFDNDWNKLANKFDKMAEARVRDICNALKPRINITYVSCGMGTFAISGDDFIALYDDDSEGPHAIDDLLDAASNERRKIFTIKDATNNDLKLLRELEELLEWWVDKTGGCDVDMEHSSPS